MQTRTAARWIAAVALSFCGGAAMAQVAQPSFLFVGHLQRASIDNPADPLSGGRMVIGGKDILLPRNLLITMPGQYLTLQDLFRGPHPGGFGEPLAAVQASTGLALDDLPRPARPVLFQASGNIVNGEYVAGLVSTMPQGFNEEGEGSGYIRAIDYVRGELLVGPHPSQATPAATLVRVRINDQQGVYGKRNAEKPGGAAMDDRYTSDPGNAPIVAMSGFPMCIPRVAPPANDARCPTGNRPANSALQGWYTCGAVPAVGSVPAHPSCNPSRPAPLMVGDYVVFSGMVVDDAPGGSYFAAHALQANLGIFTSPGANPAYVFTEVTIVGTLGEPFPDIDQEQTSRFRIVGFTTDPSRRVDVFAVDVGDNERLLAVLTPNATPPLGRVRITLPAKANFLPVTRDVRIRIRGHASQKVAGGFLDSGQYTAPVSEYIAPENIRWGVPRFPVAIPFENFCFLSRGDGPLTTLGRSASVPVVGALSPFPKSGHEKSQPRANGTRSCGD
ncbi:MAG: hypothetical protein QM769_14080 [Pseudoxanthomonas sp.]